MALQLDDLNLLDVPSEGGRPLLLRLDTIDEDPEQPRKEFEESSLRELASTIAERGVRQPISVRPHPTALGRWILNFGARRLRASRLAGKDEIPAFIDEAADSYDQVIENEQREPLTPLELALFVRRRLAANESQADIARRLGKSRQYITFATALIDPPDWLLAAYREGRCRGLTELYELRKLHRERPARVEEVFVQGGSITRERIAALRAEVRAVRLSAFTPPSAPAAPVHVDAELHTCQPTSKEVAHGRKTTSLLHVVLKGVTYKLIVDDVPSREGFVFVQSLSGGRRHAVSAATVKLLGFVSAS